MQLASGGTVGQLALEHRGEGGGHGGGDVSWGKYEGQGMMVEHRGEGEHGLLIIRQHGVEEQYSNVSLSFDFVASLAILKFEIHLSRMGRIQWWCASTTTKSPTLMALLLGMAR